MIVDGEEATRGQLAALHGEGKLVLGYISVGTIERGRGWYRSAKPYRLDYWPDFVSGTRTSRAGRWSDRNSGASVGELSNE